MSEKCECNARMAGECACGAWRDSVRGDLQEAVRMLAADNARMCDILLAADKLEAEIQRYFTEWRPPIGVDSLTFQTARARRVKDALDAFKVVRQGQ